MYSNKNLEKYCTSDDQFKYWNNDTKSTYTLRDFLFEYMHVFILMILINIYLIVINK